jgi:hypothetical protein
MNLNVCREMSIAEMAHGIWWVGVAAGLTNDTLPSAKWVSGIASDATMLNPGRLPGEKQ